MKEKCAVCRADAEYFTDTYDPKTDSRFVFPLCKKHEQAIFDLIVVGAQHLAKRVKRGVK